MTTARRKGMPGPSVAPPIARDEGLLIQELPDEVLVYDLESYRAHCLNRIAALVWRHCDGKTDVGRITEILADELDSPVSEDVVWFALRRLGRARLLQERVAPPDDVGKHSRRELVRAFGLALLLPAVTSIIAPTAASAQTCVGNCTGASDGTPCGKGCKKMCLGGKCQ
jgi:Coenzyme PQQ synthesis protein D (PqqD)